MNARTQKLNTRSSEQALAAFVAKKAEIDAMLARTQALSDDHFGYSPGGTSAICRLPSGMIRLSSAICKAPRGRTGPWGRVEPRSDARAPPLDSFQREFRPGL